MAGYQLGRQVLGELSFCDRQHLDDQERLEQLLRDAASASGATLISVHVHRYQPQGLSGVAILAESHLAIHTWPELGYAAVDAFTCGDHVNPNKAVDVLVDGLGAQVVNHFAIDRGMDPSMSLLRESDQAHQAADQS